MRTSRPLLAAAALVAVGALVACDPIPTSPAAHDPGSVLTASHGLLEATTSLYEVTSLGTLPGYTTVGTSINDAGEVAGQLNPDPSGDPLHAFLWTPGGGVVDIGETTGSNHIRYSINNATTIAGDREVDGPTEAFRWDTGGGFEGLGTLDGHDRSSGNAINDAGYVAGASWTDTETRAVLWDDAGVIQSLGTLGGDYSHAWGINDVGVVVGVSSDAAGDRDGFVWTESDGMAALRIFRPDTISRPLDVNDSGEVVGIRFVGGTGLDVEARHAFYWNEAGGLTDLHELGGFVGSSVWSRAGGVNEAGQVALLVQDGTDPTDPLRAYVWSRDGGFVHLPPLEEGARTWASDINDSGQLVGASEEGGVQVAVVWTPLAVDDALDRAEDIIDDLVATGVLKSAHAKGLRAKLERIREKIEDGRTAPAIHQLEAFIAHVEALVAAGKLTEEEGARLIEAAEAMIDALS